LLLDINNLYVSCINHHRDALAYLRALPLSAVAEIHLAGFAEDIDGAGDRLLIDSHGAPVDNAVWSLYAQAMQLIGPTPTLIERDNDVPALDVLLAEAQHAERLLNGPADPLEALA
ncbi:MAG: multinuclear nonheme iron-dependent oxidase, partial [Solimonas sp.]